MLKKSLRLTKKKEFDYAFKKGRSVYSPFLLLKYVANNQPFSRFGIIVSNKVSKKATQRNLIKRRLREIIRSVQPEIKNGFDFVLIVSPKIINEKGKVLTYQSISESFLPLLKKIKVL